MLRYDLRGHGQSDKPHGPYSLELFVADLEALIRCLGISRAHIVGLSLGGMIAQLFAITYPRLVNSLVLAGSTATYDPDGRRLLQERARTVEGEGMVAVADLLIQRWFTPTFIQRETVIVDRIRQTLHRNDPAAYADACRAASRLDLMEKLPAVKAPTLPVVGDRDASTALGMSETIHDHDPGSVLRVIEDASHLSNIEQAAEFNQAVLGFIEGPLP